jgi:hypothetical protein
MRRIWKILISLICILISFAVVAIGTENILWYHSGMDKVTADDNPGLVLGAFWCIGWAIVAGVLAAILMGIILFVRSRRSTQSSK